MSYNRTDPIRDNIKCSCKGYNLDKLLQPNILILLAEKNLHGYSIIKELESKNLFLGEKVDNTGVYRALKTLEEKKLVRSEWHVDDTGTAKKIYTMTCDGHECIENWIKTLEAYKKIIDTVIKDGRDALNSSLAIKNDTKKKDASFLNTLELIKRAKESALAGKVLDRESIIALLSINPNSEECRELGRAAREVASVVCKDRAYLWGAIGLDYRACPMNCRYCSLGESWGLVKEESEFTDQEVIGIAQKYVEEGIRWIVLRTTQFYGLEKIIALVRKIKKTVPGEYELVVNTGELDEKVLKKMEDAGLGFIYHTLRLREGIDTKFNPKDRLVTLEAAKDSPLKLVSLVEPVGIEHTNEEIADSLLNIIEYKAVVTGAMGRVPVKGTPLGEIPEIPEERLAQIIAISRLTAGFNAPDICVHKASELAISWGANVVVVETGAIPRDNCRFSSENEWNDFKPDKARRWFEANGYHVFSKIK
jgi:biotin synthase